MNGDSQLNLLFQMMSVEVVLYKIKVIVYDSGIKKALVISKSYIALNTLE